MKSIKQGLNLAFAVMFTTGFVAFLIFLTKLWLTVFGLAFGIC